MTAIVSGMGCDAKQKSLAPPSPDLAFLREELAQR